MICFVIFKIFTINSPEFMANFGIESRFLFAYVLSSRFFQVCTFHNYMFYTNMKYSVFFFLYCFGVVRVAIGNRWLDPVVLNIRCLLRNEKWTLICVISTSTNVLNFEKKLSSQMWLILARNLLPRHSCKSLSLIQITEASTKG